MEKERPQEEMVRFTPQPEVLTELSEHDLRTMQRLLEGAFDSIESQEVAEHIPSIIESDNADVIVARNSQGEIASMMVVNVFHGGAKLRGRIDEVVTDESYRRQGYAGVTLDYALEWFKNRGVKKATLVTEHDRVPAHELYKSRGFTTRDVAQFEINIP